MKYLNVFDNKSALDSSVTSINHGDGAYIHLQVKYQLD